MNLCVFNVEAVGSLHNEDYAPNRLSHIVEAIRTILKTNYYTYYVVIIQDATSTLAISPTKDRTAIDKLENLKTTSAPPHPFRSLRQSLFVARQQAWDSVHIVSFISSEEALSDVVLRQNELQTLRNFHIHFVLLGDVLTPTSHTRTLVRSLARRQSRGWTVTENDLNKKRPYDRLLMRMSEGIAIVPRRKPRRQFPHMKAGQVPSESKAGKFISCKIVSHPTDDKVMMIPVPIVSRQQVLATLQCGRCTIKDGKCVSSNEIGTLCFVELSPILFKVVWRTEIDFEGMTMFYGEATTRIVENGNNQFLVIDTKRGKESNQSVYWTTSGAEEFSEIMELAMQQEIPQSYTKIMQTIWDDNKQTLINMEEKYMNMKKEKDIVDKVDEEYTKSEESREKAEVNRVVRHDDKKSEGKESDN
ncbi:hypothetical protein EIN_164060 [Entamoeba invadens IP1]|uniref:Uncharacterized protein n=2 Tax=Entamoeba invadens TaxID=33085 RepID=A0A0A1U7J7_ENTIV|nr:hypothetical protein EIN_164060 [Entamoeba invadens IP1]ELP89026.1 hypothetical protein EIN_164060 [Entamoeba invadens IP1]BAN41324.1 hypothetical protein [Entamoeba invadens]|eukprot:XP_004255797.1 hypothetical protein EIN_164060 [Entamoeba invadens IP1]